MKKKEAHGKSHMLPHCKKKSTHMQYISIKHA